MKDAGYKKLLSIVLLMILLLHSIPVTASADVTQQTVRVGFFQSDGYHVTDTDGSMSGYGFDFLQMILRYNDWKYEYVGYEKDWQDMLDMLDSGQIDMLTLANKTEDRVKLYDYSSKPIGTSSTIMTVRMDNTNFIRGDYKSYDGAVVGLVSDSYHNEGFAEFAQKCGFTYTPKYYSNVNEINTALQKGEIDAAVTSNMRQLNKEQILEEFNAQDYYVIVKKGNEALMEQIDQAIDSMDIYSPDWRKSLYQKYYAGLNDVVVSLSADEREYLDDLKEKKIVIKAAMNPELKPYSYFEDGEAKGIVPQIFKEIADKLGLDYEIVYTETRSDYKKVLNEKAVDIDLTAYLDYSLAANYNLKETDAYMTSTVAMISRKDNTNAKEDYVVASLKDPTEFIAYNQDLIYAHEYKEYDSIEKCIEAVKNREADVTYQYAYTAERAVLDDYRNEIQSTILPDYNFGLCIGVENEKDHRLLSVLNKGVNSLKSSTVQSITLEQTTLPEQNTSVIAMVYARPYLAIGVVILMLGLVFSLILIFFYRKNQQKEKKQALILKDALEAAQNASNAKGMFVSRVSHEIRTPLNAVIGYMTMARDSVENQKQMLHCIDNSEIAAKQLLGIINDVLDISALENGKMKIADDDFELKALLSNITTVFYGQAKKKGVHFEVMIENLTEEWVVGDALRVNQILMNLLSNAIKFTPPKGTVKLFVEQVRKEEKEVSIRFAVSDSGIGMSKEYQNRLFTPFEQESAKTAQKYGGTGLGLSIVKNLVNMMHGAIEVNSEKDQGTTFTVLLTFACSDKNGKESKPHENYSHVRALIVEEQKENSDYIRGLLKRCGVKNDMVYSKQTAIRRIVSRQATDYPYDLCIFEWNVADMDSVEMVSQIKKSCETHRPILVAAAFDTTSFEAQALAAGVDYVIEKPLFQSTMFNLLVDIYGKYEVKETAQAEDHTLAGYHVLLAEDNAMNMEIAVNILNKAGLVVDSAWDGQEACEKFQKSKPGEYQAILMDIQMPVMDGYEATKTIRQMEHADAKTIPIIAMTANAFAEDVSAALAAGMNGHIAKPVDYGKLFSVLKDVM